MLLILLWTLPPVSSAQTPPDSAVTETSWYAFPTLFYTPETSVGGGAAGGFVAPLSGSVPSSLQGDLSATLRSQYQFNLDADLYLGEGRWRVLGDVSLSSFPDVFYGIGPQARSAMEEEYTSRFADASVQAERRIASLARVGVRMRLRTEAITSVEEGQLLDTAAVPGHSGGRAAGIGLVVTRDTRDRLFFPLRGHYLTVYGVAHGPALGSDYTFTRGVLDARAFVPLGRKHVLALQGYADVMSGTAPFTMLPELGGMLRMRGYREGRFRDDVMLTAQAEWRFPLVWRFDGALFGSVGAVSDRLGTWGAGGVERAAGVGLRFRMNDAGVHLRLDYAVGRGTSGFYATAAQPF